jgi:hypothetical protein
MSAIRAPMRISTQLPPSSTENRGLIEERRRSQPTGPPFYCRPAEPSSLGFRESNPLTNGGRADTRNVQRRFHCRRLGPTDEDAS